MENLGLIKSFWRDRSVFITGHTGFKGGWLALWLSKLGANIYGYSMKAPTSVNFYDSISLKNRFQVSTIGNILDLKKLEASMRVAIPSIIFHLAAQSLVSRSYNDPIETFDTNVIGTANVFQAARQIETVEAIINITTDKCYDNQESNYLYKEDDRLGGYDPYSSSKACSELLTSAFRNSFFKKTKVKLASVRAGNVIGGGDWAIDRLIPDFFRSIENNDILKIRSPNSIRPWQHVFEPLSGYLILAQKMVINNEDFGEAWNFGPEESDCKSVSWILNLLQKKFKKARWQYNSSEKFHESNVLKLDSSKAKSKLGWVPRWSLETAIKKTSEWYEARNCNEMMEEFSLKQLQEYEIS